jgi:hypothetical protein
MKHLTKAAIFTSIFVLTACASPVQSKLTSLENNNFTLSVTTNVMGVLLSFDYKLDNDKVYGTLGTLEYYLFKENNQYKQISRLNKTSPWLIENSTKSDFEDLKDSMLPFTTETENNWFVRESNSNTYEVLEIYLSDLITEPSIEGVDSASFVIESDGIKFMLTTSSSLLTASYQYYFTEIGTTSFSIPNYL